MTAGSVTHVLLDFFGTLAAYSHSRTEQGYHRTHELARSLGVTAGYQDMLLAWGQASEALDRRSAPTAASTPWKTRPAPACGADQPSASSAEIAAFAQSYLAEWNTGVSYPAGPAGRHPRAASRYRLAVVSNTHDRGLVPAHLSAMGIAGHFEAVITSIDVGWRKPDPRIYAAALTRLGIQAEAAIFAGDTFEADYAGPVRSGLLAYLIDPQGRHDIPAGQRLSSLADLPGRLGIG